MKFNLKAVFIATSLMFGATAFITNSARAASSLSFEIQPDFGPLTGETFSGNFEFDDSLLTGAGNETVALSSFSLNFLGDDFSLTNDPLAFAQFFDGEFLGVEYATSNFQFLSGLDFFDPSFSSINDSFFSYNISTGAGFGDITYKTASTLPPTTIPEPSMVYALIGMGTMILGKKTSKTNA